MIKMYVFLVALIIKSSMADAQLLGSNVGDFLQISSMSGASYNIVYNRTWLVRNAAGSDWYTTRLHDGIAVDTYFQTPKVDTKTWWERDPLYDIQSWGNGANTYLTINNGNVGIGTANPQAKLTVNGNILAKEVKIKPDISVPDYVFKTDYKLLSLEEIAVYIKRNGHLPEVPSAVEVKHDGLDLAAMNLLLLKKVEELTLHLIAKEKDIKNLKESFNGMRRELEDLKKVK